MSGSNSGVRRLVTPVGGPLASVVRVPGSKSIANRALVCAALAEGVSTISGVAPGDDTAAMLDCLAALGVRIEPSAVTGGAAFAGDDRVAVHGTGGRLDPGPRRLEARLAGTTSRFVTALAALGAGPYVVDGEAALQRRPMGELHDALVALGAVVTPEQRGGHLPVEIRGPVTRADAELSMRGDVSSQFVSALMLIAPSLPDGLRIRLTTPLVSRPYLGITAAVMAAFGVDGVMVGDDEVVVPAGRYRATDYEVEPDASSAGYPLAAAAVVGGTVHVPGLSAGSLQGDARFADLLAEMGCEVVHGAAGVTVTRDGPLRGIDVDMVEMSDLVPTLACVAPFAIGATTIGGVGFIRAKESDRIGDLCAELQAVGVDAEELDDGLRIRPGFPHGGVIHTHHDHRLAMAGALLGLVVDGIEIEDPDVVTKSWPGYWAMLDELVLDADIGGAR